MHSSESININQPNKSHIPKEGKDQLEVNVSLESKTLHGPFPVRVAQAYSDPSLLSRC